MPRQARIISNSGIYHIKILEIIKNLKEEVQFDVIAYCIMDNHIHLLVKAEEKELKTLMKKMNVKYAMYYNAEEKRNGHVFQDRYRSEAVEDDNYMIGAIRYIHNNPVKAGIVRKAIEYQWSSKSDYLKGKSDIISHQYAKDVMDLFKDKDEFIAFHDIDDNNIYIDTKEEEGQSRQNIISNVMEKYIDKNFITDEKQVTQQREDLAEELLNLKLITYREIAQLCNLTVHRVSEIKRVKEI